MPRRYVAGFSFAGFGSGLLRSRPDIQPARGASGKVAMSSDASRSASAGPGWHPNNDSPSTKSHGSTIGRARGIPSAPSTSCSRSLESRPEHVSSRSGAGPVRRQSRWHAFLVRGLHDGGLLRPASDAFGSPTSRGGTTGSVDHRDRSGNRLARGDDGCRLRDPSVSSEAFGPTRHARGSEARHEVIGSSRQR